MSLLLSCSMLLCSADVVILEDGSRLTGSVVSAKGDPVVAVASAAGRCEVPRARVQSVQDRDTLLVRYRDLRSAGEALHCLLGRAQWCLDHGLWEETLDELDLALREHPDSDEAHRLLQRALGQVSLEGKYASELSNRKDVMQLLSLARGTGAARAAVARHWLATAPLASMREILQQASESSRLEVRRECLRALIAREESAALSTLILRSLNEKDPALRQEARDAVLQSGHPDLVVPYVHALRDSRAHVRANALPVLEHLQDPRAIASLISALAPRQSSGGSSVPRNHIFVGRQISLVRDFEVEIAQGAVIANPEIGVIQEGALLDVRATSSPAAVRTAGRAGIVGALERISGRRFGSDVGAWREWWAAEGKEILAQHARAQARAAQRLSDQRRSDQARTDQARTDQAPTDQAPTDQQAGAQDSAARGPADQAKQMQ